MKTKQTISAILGAIFAAATAHAADPLQIGAWVGSASDTSRDGNYPQPTRANVSAFVDLQGHPVDYVEFYSNWPEAWAKSKTYADIAASFGAKLFVTWQPSGYTAPDIVSGKADAYLTKYATDLKDYPNEVWLRPLHEANGGDWYSWAVGNSSMANTNEDVAEAFRHIVRIFRDVGATKVKWVWTTNAQNMTTGNPTSYEGTYPGDEWCDYISIDGYNFGKFHTVANSGWNSSWQTFSQVFKPAYTALAGINKPIFVAEFGSSELGGDKAKWTRDAFASLPSTFPRFFALMVFSMNDANGDWRINTTDSSLQAWKECISKYAPTSGILRHSSVPSTMLRSNGLNQVTLDLPIATNVRLLVTDLQGRLLDNRDLGVLATGLHPIDLGLYHGIRLAILQAGPRTETLLLAGS
jgi:beta-mannanase